MSLKQMIQNLKDDLHAIEMATDYVSCGHLKFGGIGDSSDRAKIRIGYVDSAEKEFVHENKKAILKRAAEMLRDELMDAGVEL